jgi:hypothetical protein
MTRTIGRFAWVLPVVAALASGDAARAQISASTRFARGQSIQPVYEGWEQNADGSYSMWFGYLNRNWEQRITIPVGPDNNIEPGGPDRGQMTVFETGNRRRFPFAFKVTLPADWPKDKDLVWTVKANGVTQTAIGSLWSVWLVNDDVIATNRGSQRIYDPRSKNKPPVVTQPASGGTVATGTPLVLTMAVSDDGLPRRRAAGELAPGGAGGGIAREGRGRGTSDGMPSLRDSLKVSWFQWRGPGIARFDPEQARVLDADGKQSNTGGKATTKVTFDRPGTYVLRAFAEDMSVFTMPPDITVTVTGAEVSAVSQR